MLPGFTSLDVPRLVGVYLLVRDGEIVYVGQSNDVVGRIIEHRKSGKQFTDTMFLALPEELLCSYEGALIRALRPRLNKGCPAGGARDGEILEKFGLKYELSLASPRRPRPFVATTFGKAVREIRKRANLGVREFSRRLGVCQATVTQWERGYHAAPLSRIAQIAAEFSVDVADLVLESP